MLGLTRLVLGIYYDYVKSHSLCTSASVVVFLWETYHFRELGFVLFFILFNELF
jgi:hypothetical protein